MTGDGPTNDQFLIMILLVAALIGAVTRAWEHVTPEQAHHPVVEATIAHE